MVRDAEKAGFNPLTAIRNGGSAGFTTSTTTSPGLSSAQTIGKALGAAGSFFANFDPMADQKKELEYQLVQAQLENLQADTAMRMKASMGGVPTYTAGAVKRGAGAAALSGAPMTPVVSPPTVTNPWHSANIDPKVLNGDAFEQRYGDAEIPSMLYAGYVGLKDIGANYPGIGTAMRGLDAGVPPLLSWLTDPVGYAKTTVKTRRLTPSEKKATDESWLPSWVPRVGIKWH